MIIVDALLLTLVVAGVSAAFGHGPLAAKKQTPLAPGHYVFQMMPGLSGGDPPWTKTIAYWPPEFRMVEEETKWVAYNGDEFAGSVPKITDRWFKTVT